jgi:hypothetical protein
MKVVIERDMQTYLNRFRSSFAEKRIVYTEYQKETNLRGFSYTKAMFVKEKYPRFPKRYRDQLVELI